MPTDLDRIPEPYRARVQQALDAARASAIARCSDGDLERAVAEAQRVALAPYLAIAAAAKREARLCAASAPDGFAEAYYEDARAAVWARRMAERDAAAKPGEAPAERVCVADPHVTLERRPEPTPPNAAPSMRHEARTASGFTFGSDTAAAIFSVRDSRLEVDNGQGAQALLDAVARYLETHVAALPSDLVQRAIGLLAATLPAGPLAPATAEEGDAHATLRTVAALLRTMPAGFPEVHVGDACYGALAAIPGAETFAQPYPLDATHVVDMLDRAELIVDGLRVSCSRQRPVTAEERAMVERGEPLLRRTGGAS